MMQTRIILVLFAIFTSTIGWAQKEDTLLLEKPLKTIQCILKGEVINRPQSSLLILSKSTEDIRTAKVVNIPIVDGKFEYVLNCDYEELYQLTFSEEYQNGSWMPAQFFSEQGVVTFALNPESEFEKNVITGGILNREYQAYEESLNRIMRPIYAKRTQLEDKGEFYTPEVTAIQKQVESLKMDDPKREELIKEYQKLSEAGKDLTPAAIALNKEAMEASQTRKNLSMQYIQEKPTLVGYTALKDAIFEGVHYTKSDITALTKLYNASYAPKYPNHPYTNEIKDLIIGASIKVGGRYVDVTATDLQGNNVQLSDQIKGKVALIHLWASWCGPCRKYGMEMIPVYETYKDKGFVVVGIARENTDTKAMEAAIKKDNYPWKNLVELNDKSKIWYKYGIGNAGGGEFLVDKNGVILAVSPTAEEVKKILEEQFK